MSDQNVVAKFRLTAAKAQERIRQAATNSANVVITEHAEKRLQQRGLTTRDLRTILTDGYVDDPPDETESHDWKCKVTRTMPGGRIAGAITVIVAGGRLIVITVEWEDGK